MSHSYEECIVPGATCVTSVMLVKQISNEPCTLDQTYGSEKTVIWVSSGCRGHFAVCYV